MFCFILKQLDSSKEYQYLPPTQPPIRPPYQQACQLRKNNLLAKEDSPSGALDDSLSALDLNKSPDTNTVTPGTSDWLLICTASVKNLLLFYHDWSTFIFRVLRYTQKKCDVLRLCTLF